MIDAKRLKELVGTVVDSEECEAANSSVSENASGNEEETREASSDIEMDTDNDSEIEHASEDSDDDYDIETESLESEEPDSDEDGTNRVKKYNYDVLSIKLNLFVLMIHYELVPVSCFISLVSTEEI